jgi:hypothetical protein
VGADDSRRSKESPHNFLAQTKIIINFRSI